MTALLRPGGWGMPSQLSTAGPARSHILLGHTVVQVMTKVSDMEGAHELKEYKVNSSI